MPGLQKQWVCAGLHTGNRTATALLAAGMGKDLVSSRQEDQ